MGKPATNSGGERAEHGRNLAALPAGLADHDKPNGDQIRGNAL